MTSNLNTANQSLDNSPQEQVENVFHLKEVNLYYGNHVAVRDVNLEIPEKQITAFIGPSGCGKSTVLRTLNRLNDLIEGFSLDGQVFYYDQDIYAKKVDPVALRRKIGMVFQQPNPFPKSIYDNVAYGPRVTEQNSNDLNLDELVEQTLKQAALWDEVKDKLSANALSLSGGQQQRLCIARGIATNPDVILLDEPASSLDPISTLKIEELLHELAENYTIVIVTHNMQQATRISDMTAFFSAEAKAEGKRGGYLVEFAATEQIFQNPAQEETRRYVSGEFG